MRKMLKFTNALRDWTTDSFKRTLKNEIENLKTGSLPLEHGVSQGGRIDDSNITATILNSTENLSRIETRVGIFFTEVVGGCNCNDDPIEINAYCEIRISIDKTTASTDIDVFRD